MSQQTPDRGSFGGIGFILAAAGSAHRARKYLEVPPTLPMRTEAAPFVLVYLAGACIMGSHLAEVLIGRRTQQSPVGAFLVLAKDVAGGKVWSVFGWLGIVAGFLYSFLLRRGCWLDRLLLRQMPLLVHQRFHCGDRGGSR